jgi:hypothetical protein
MSTSNPSGQSSATTRGQKAAATRKRNAAAKAANTTKASARRTTTTAKTTARAASDATAAESKVRVNQVQQIAERAVLVPVGASLLARDNVVSTVTGLTTKFRSRAAAERELKRYERRGATARNRLERQMRRTRTKVERELRQRRTSVEKTVKQNRHRVERDIRSARKDFGKQSSTLTSRVEKLVTDAQSRIGSIA